MKTLKYRSITSALGIALLSVFLFTTSCEKDTEDHAVPAKKSKFAKFKALHFTSETAAASSTSNAGSGTFTGNGRNDITFANPGGEEPSFATAYASESQSFTDPQASSSNFVVASPFNFLMGGGSISLDGKSYTVALGLCASSAAFGKVDAPGGHDLDAYIGIAGDLDLNGNEDGEIWGDNFLFIYAFSYNKGTKLGSFEDFDNGNVDKAAFLLVVEGNNDEANLYFATSGNINFAGNSISTSGVKMRKVNEDEGELEGRSISLEAALECGSFGSFFDGDDDDDDDWDWDDDDW